MGKMPLVFGHPLNPPMVKELVQISVEHNVALAEKAIDLGADFVVLGDDYGSSMGPLMSPAQFEEFFLPGLQEVVKAIKDKGAYCIKHCCGDINLLLDMIVGTGIDALHPLDAAAGMDIAAVKQNYGDRICVIGGVDCGDLLSLDPPERVVEEVKKVLTLQRHLPEYLQYVVVQLKKLPYILNQDS
ncbi:uroporphyrinogen decarboxylase [Candidatus Hakubella thermalkaliphila]|uniref:Uroporphyrinogen decarboxylase n=2 Tax=Candidatus Hakubella thermalkaliphila TaxID=2754717 RepID=A0A6V8P9S8_9ACTN|nr:uroporphyrinogen decarboxylase [Candidatus Hakubella thermalkaliphila]GFP36470.1 uroporphyrinogen decarboxylase [Candidatus Hakubella thermalkaliphila]